jgi:predicted acyltransferase
MTYADMIFPAFLFVMGVSIPPAVDRRVAAGDPDGKAKSKTACATGIAV